MKLKAQPKPVIKIVCPKCGELMIKIYPFSSMGISKETQITPCVKCLAKNG